MYGTLKDTIENACEDISNGIPFNAADDAGISFVTSDDASLLEIMHIILDQAHLADSTLTKDVRLPDTPTLREAMAGDEREQWLAAIQDELDTIKEAGTWTLVNHTLDIQNVVGCRFVLQKKRGEDGRVIKFKARLVAQGFCQE